MEAMEVKEITVQELKDLIDKKEDIELIDVRKQEEYDFCHMNGKLIPMHEIPERHTEISQDKKVIIHCHHGGRSKKVIQWLEANFGSDNLYNLVGGIHAWSLEIDNEVPVY